MNITEEELRKMFDFMREMHENYTKVLERENEVLRNTLAETQKKLDEALEAANKKKDLTDEQVRQVREIQEEWERNNKNGNGTLGGPWTTPSFPPYQYPPTISPTCIGGTTPTYYTTSTTSVSTHNAISPSEDVKKQYQIFMNAMSDKASGKDDDN